jgi:DNA (cytosine-5)-methyltransferase 1
MKEITVGSDFSGVGAFDVAIGQLAEEKGFKVRNVFACDLDKHARVTYLANHEAPGYYPEDVYDRPIPEESLDIYMTSPPCQSFSLAGKRKGKDDDRGILFFNSLEFIKKNKPRYFIFENVKGLLSDDGGKTFEEWTCLLGGQSINGTMNFFPHEDSVPYHLYYKVLNTKEHGIPQNRERVFLIGIRDDEDNYFSFPAIESLNKALKDVLEENVDEKYFLSDKAVSGLLAHKQRNKENGNGFGATISDEDAVSQTIRARYYKDGSDQLLKVDKPSLKIKNANSKGYDEATQGDQGDSINLQQPNSETRRGRVGHGVAQTLDTGCSQGVCIPVLTPDRAKKRQNGRRFKEDGDPSFTLTTQDQHGIYDGIRIRRLTPRECFRLQAFPDSFVIDVVSDTQAYKQAGNSITTRVLKKIINNLNL